MAAVVCRYYDEQQKTCTIKSISHVPKGLLKRLVCEKKDKFGLSNDCIINIEAFGTK